MNWMIADGNQRKETVDQWLKEHYVILEKKFELRIALFTTLMW